MSIILINARRTLWSVILVVICGSAPMTVAQTNSPFELECYPVTYAVGYFNGVANTMVDAQRSLKGVRDLLGKDDPDGNQIAYEVFYNNYSNLLADVAETFRQKADEIDPEVSERFWELFWLGRGSPEDALFIGGGIVDILDTLPLPLQTRLQNFVESIRVSISEAIIGGIARALVNEPLEEYEEHATRLTNWKRQNRSALLVAHSQGNLFVNQVHDFGKLVIGYTDDDLRVVHVAPASKRLNGPHILSSSDTVIGLVGKALGASTIPDSNVDVVYTQRDSRGHGFLEIYLEPRTLAWDKTTSILNNQFNQLVAEGKMLDESDVAFKVTLSWPQGVENLDLWVSELGAPTIGNSITGSITSGTSGNLAEDSPVGPEVYTANCDPKTLQEGTYSFFDLNASGSNLSNPYTLSVESPSQAPFHISGMTEGNQVKPALRGIVVQREEFKIPEHVDSIHVNISPYFKYNIYIYPEL